MKYDCNHIILGRMPRANKEDEFKTAFVKIFTSSEDPLTGKSFPAQELTYPNVEHVRITGAEVDFYPEGNDIVVKCAKFITITQKKNEVMIEVTK